MSDLSSLTQGAVMTAATAKKIHDLSLVYEDTCRVHDSLVVAIGNAIISSNVSIKHKKKSSGAMPVTVNFRISDKLADKIYELLIEDLQERCRNLHKQIEELAREL